ncbi:TspO/MBR family protein [Intestinimonas massiliensis (ex Afouda et al. 2020)]|uniref:TspO/MBR family protein n=1 Tax=Intestinimonas massiliensis (ex Afouda et al. 2020) TaxID=1673721 RepID=UPI0010301249|nr:TspO/MBR family protein [Intestinimonas massiliensis (ex Afouda et al. 2020)]
MKTNTWKTYALWILGTEAVGGLSGWLTRKGADLYARTVSKPPLSPPSMVFPIVWSALFALMGVSAARVWQAPPSPERSRGLGLFGTQLAFNFFWSIIFFNAQAYGLALIWLAVLWALILWMLLTFRKVDKWAAWLQVPYLLWVSFAAYLNFGVWALN